MLVVDALGPGGSGPRYALFGSCRLVTGSFELAQRGSVRLVARGGPLTHTIPAALQADRIVRGADAVPAEIVDWVIGREPEIFHEGAARALAAIDVVFVEVCDTRQLVLDGALLNLSAVTTGFVQPRGRPLLGWFRQLGLAGRPDEATIATSLAALAAAGQLDALAERAVRGMHFAAYAADDLPAQIAALRARFGRRIVLVTHSIVPGDDSVPMRERRALADAVAAAAQTAGLEWFDPSRFFDRLPRTEIFAAEGRDIHHFTPAQDERMARALHALARQPALSSADAVAAAFEADVPAVDQTPLFAVDRLLQAAMRERIAAAGAAASGLDGHYEASLAAGSLFGSSLRQAYNFIVREMPRTARIVTVGAGAGELPLALATAGFQVTACLGSRARAALAGQAAAGLALAGGTLRLLPARLPGREPIDLLVALDAEMPAGDEAGLLETAGRSRAVLLELRLFGRRREGSPAWAALLAALAADRQLDPATPLAGHSLAYLERRGWADRLARRLGRHP